MTVDNSESLQDGVVPEQVLPRSAESLSNDEGVITKSQKKLLTSLRKKAMDLLARREHAVEEMRQKLHASLKKKAYFKKKAAKKRAEERGAERGAERKDSYEDAYLDERGRFDEAVNKVVEDLQNETLLSDERFTEAFVRYRQNNGHGPMRIQTELRERGVSEKIQAAWLDFADPQWFEQIAQVRNKRFGECLPEDYKERARQARFLQYRGFTSDQIKQTLAGDSYD